MNIELTWDIEFEERDCNYDAFSTKPIEEVKVGVIKMNGVEIYRTELYDHIGYDAEEFLFSRFARDIAPEKEIRLR